MRRELKHPQVTICEDGDGGLSIEFLAPGSTFGAVEIVLSADEAERLAEDIDAALVFVTPTGPAVAASSSVADPDPKEQ